MISSRHWLKTLVRIELWASKYLELVARLVFMIIAFTDPVLAETPKNQHTVREKVSIKQTVSMSEPLLTRDSVVLEQTQKYLEANRIEYESASYNEMPALRILSSKQSFMNRLVRVGESIDGEFRLLLAPLAKEGLQGIYHELDGLIVVSPGLDGLEAGRIKTVYHEFLHFFNDRGSRDYLSILQMGLVDHLVTEQNQKWAFDDYFSFDEYMAWAFELALRNKKVGRSFRGTNRESMEIIHELERISTHMRQKINNAIDVVWNDPKTLTVDLVESRILIVGELSLGGGRYLPVNYEFVNFPLSPATQAQDVIRILRYTKDFMDNFNEVKNDFEAIASTNKKKERAKAAVAIWKLTRREFHTPAETRTCMSVFK